MAQTGQNKKGRHQTRKVCPKKTLSHNPFSSPDRKSAFAPQLLWHAFRFFSSGSCAAGRKGEADIPAKIFSGCRAIL